MKDWNLSDCIGFYESGCIDWWTLYTKQTNTNFKPNEESDIKVKDVKEFIKRLSIKLNDNSVSPRQAQILVEELGKLAGDKLI